MMNIHERNSQFELLRILCIFGILSMHIWGAYYTVTGFNQIVWSSPFLCVNLPLGTIRH